MKRPGQHEIIIRRQLGQSGTELALVDQTAGLVDDDEIVDRPSWEAVRGGGAVRGRSGGGTEPVALWIRTFWID